VEHVTVPTSHADRVDENTGFVRQLRIVDNEDGSSSLQAGLHFTEPQIKEKVANGSIANTSVGVIFDYLRKRDGKKYTQALQHVALTNRPWIDGMEPFGIAASEDEVEVVAMQFDQEEDESAGEAEGTEPETPEAEADEAALSAEAEDEVDAEQPAKRSLLQALKDFINGWSDEEIEQVAEEIVEETADASLEPNEFVVNETQQTTIEESITASEEPTAPRQRCSPLVAAQRDRQLRLAEENQRSPRGGEQNNMSDLSHLELSDEAKAEVDRILAENAELRKVQREASVDTYVNELKEMGFDQVPGFLKEVRQIMLSDDGGPALNLSEDEGVVSLTATDIVKRMVKALPTKDGQVQLAEQAIEVEGAEKPPLDASEELPQEEKTTKAADFLGIKI
jgi:hypothetical protein